MVLLPLPSLSHALSSNGILSHGSVCRLSSLPKSNFKRSKCNYTEQNGLHTKVPMRVSKAIWVLY